MFDPKAHSYGKDSLLSAQLSNQAGPLTIETTNSTGALTSLASPSVGLQMHHQLLTAARANTESVASKNKSALSIGQTNLWGVVDLSRTCAVSKQSSFTDASRPNSTKSPLAGLRSIAVSGPVAAAIGSTIITIPITTIGAVALGCTAIWTAINEFRAATRQTTTSSTVCESPSGPSRRGLTGLLLEKFHGPGFGPMIQAMCYMYSASVAFGACNIAIGAVFTVFAIGASAAAHIGNRGYTSPARERIPIERHLKRSWDALPERLRTVLTDPGACFCSGNFALILYQLDFSRTIGNVVTTSLFGLGTALAAVGVARGLFPLVSGRATTLTGTASIVGGFGDISLGILSLIMGNGYTGTATIAWGIANILYGVKIGESFIARWLNHALSSSEMGINAPRLPS